MNNNIIYSVWLSLLDGIGGISGKQLYELYGDYESVYKLTADEIDSLDMIKSNQKLVMKNKNLDYAKSIVEKCESMGIEIIAYDDKEYPDMLREIYDPPIVLYKKGIPFDFNNTALTAIVGARKASVYGVRCAEDYASDLSKSNIVVVSGMASGVDGAAHRGALKAGMPTVAVLGNGIDICYPLENRDLYERIKEYGVLISEYPPATSPHSGNFPKRNRIIAAISHATVVVEAGLRSGSLKTAEYANEYGKMVFAIPNMITNRAAVGSNNLIKDYACITTTPNDIVEYFYGRFGVGKMSGKDNSDISLYEKMLENLSEDEKKILSVLSEVPKHIDRIVRESGLPAGRVNANLTLLEMKALVSAMPGSSYALRF